MPLGAIIGGGLGLLGGIIGGNSAENAAATSAAAQTEAARIAAEAQKFRPVGITTRFGASKFGYGIPGEAAPVQSAYATPEEYQRAAADYQARAEKSGYLTTAGYDVAPDVAALRDRLLSQAGGQGFQTAEQAQAAQQSLFGLGQQYLAQSPQEAAQQWMQSQQALLQPGRERAQAGLTQNLFNTGRGGLAVAQGGMMGAANPEQQALLNAQMMQDLELATRAQEQGRAQTSFGAGLFGTGIDIASGGYNPLKAQFGLAQGLEQAGQAPLDIGAQLGGRSAAAGANVGQTLLQGGMGAARTMQQANAYSPVGSALSGLAGNQQFTQGFGNLFGGGGAINQAMYPSGNPLQTGQYADPGYWT